MNWPIEDMQKDPKEIVLDLIYAENGIRLCANKASLGTPEEVDQRPDIDSDANTFVPIELIEGVDDRFQGNNGLLYRRFHFSDFELAQVFGDFSFPTTIHSLLPFINAETGLNIQPEDVEDLAYPTKVPSVELIAKPGSLVWWGRYRLGVNYGLLRKANLSGFVKYVNESI